MILLSELSQEELKYICDRMPTAAARCYFQKNPKEYAKIRPGFRAEKLSNVDVHSILIKHANKYFISNFIEKMISDWLEEIEDEINNLKEEGYTDGEALLKTIPDSVFCDNSELFFKFSNRNYDADYLLLFRDALSLIHKGEEALEDQIGDEAKQRGSEYARKSAEKIHELESKIEVCHKKESDLTKSLQETKLQIEELECTLRESEGTNADLQAELDHYRNLATYADEGFEQSEYRQFQHISIGQVSYDYSGQIWIDRLADIVNGEVWEFFADDTQPHYFENRDRLYWKNGPDDDGAMGIWSWKADPRDTDSSKDFITCEFNRTARITEVVELPQCNTLAEIATVISNGIEYHPISEKVLFTCTTSSGAKEGLLCCPGKIEYSGGMAKLSSSVFMLPHYSIRQSDTMKISGVRIFRKINLGVPQSVFRVRTPYDAVKKMLLSRVTIPALRDFDLSRKEAQKCKRFLESIPTLSIIQELMDAYECSEKEAENYLAGFIEHADTHLSRTDLDMKTISEAIERNPDLIQMCKEQLNDEWETENSKKIDEAQKQFEKIAAETEEKIAETQELIQKKEDLAKELNVIEQQIESREQFAADVENKISERIEAARKDASDFVSQMAFVSPLSVAAPRLDRRQSATEIMTLRSKMEIVPGTTVDDIDTFEEELIDNLRLIGYEEEAAIEMSSAISFGICNRLPVVIGENASAIGECLAATMGGKSLTQMFLFNQNIDFSRLLVETTQESDNHPSVLLFHGVLDSYNVSIFNALSAYLQSEDKNVVVLLSLEGIPANMISSGVWNRSIYVDGDDGLTGLRTKPVHALELDMKFERIIDGEEYKTRKKEINAFAGLMSNLQLRLYAKYLAAFGLSLNESNTVLQQMINVSRSEGIETKLKTIFHEKGLANGEKLIAKYL